MLNLLAATENTNIHSFDVPWFMYAIVVAVLIIYALIEARHTKRDHVISIKEATIWSVIYVAAALLFTIPVYIFIGGQAAGEYLAAWGIEKALSLDNLFVMGLIFASFKVPRALERRMLNYGIAGAIIFRLIFILAGLALLQKFEWVSLIFGLILLRAAWGAFHEARGGKDIEEEVEFADKRAWKFITRVLPVHHEYDGHKLTTRVNGKRMLTMMAAVIILIEFTDIIFAVDSVPAVLAVSPDRFIAYSSNVFAILGLRALFFVYQAVADRFWALTWALAGILAWISFKLIIAPFGYHVPVAFSLGVLFAFLAGSIMVSIIWKRKEPPHKVNIGK